MQETRSETPNNEQEKCSKIREVWDQNFDEELRELMIHLPKAKYVAMDTEFPGTVFNKT